MGTARFLKAMAMVALFNGTLFMCVREEALATEKEEEAKKYTEQLRSSKDAKVRAKALIGLGELAQVKKSFITDALPDVYKATEDKDPGVRAAAAEALGKADEPFSKAGDVLMKLVKDDKDDAVKIGALRGLSVMGQSAKEASKTIQEVVKATAGDKKSKLGQVAKDALKAVSGRKN